MAAGRLELLKRAKDAALFENASLNKKFKKKYDRDFQSVGASGLEVPCGGIFMDMSCRL